MFLAAGALALGGCADKVTGPTPVGAAPAGSPRIEGFPTTQQIRAGENLLLSLKDVPGEVESIHWFSSAPRVASVTSTPAVSPCGSACAWLRGESAGQARIEALLCYVDGTCMTVSRARVCSPHGDHEVETALSVTAS